MLGPDEASVERAAEGKAAFALVLAVLEILIIASAFLPRFFLSFLFSVDPWGWLAHGFSVVFIIWMNGIMLWMILWAGRAEAEAD